MAQQLRRSPARREDYMPDLKKGIDGARHKEGSEDYRYLHRETPPNDPSHGGTMEVGGEEHKPKR